jgi:hypothetical protein
VVLGQHLVQANSDIFLGWTRGPEGRDFYVRQLRDMKFSIDVEAMTADRLVDYAKLCGFTLARAHARSGDPVAIDAYLGRSDVFDEAMVRFASAYADQNAGDHSALLAAIESGRITACADDGQTWQPTRISGSVLDAPLV